MDFTTIFRDIKLNKTEVNVLNTIFRDPDRCIDEGVRAIASQCFSNPSTLVRLAKKLKFRGWIELVYFVKFNLTMPRQDITTESRYIETSPPEQLAYFLSGLKENRILIHGSGFSQLIAQYMYNKALVVGMDASLALWPDYEILEQQSERKFDAVWIISKSGRSQSALNWIKALENKGSKLICFTGDHNSPLAQASDIRFIIHDPQKYDDDIYWSNPFFGYCLLGFEHLLKLWFDQKQSRDIR